MKLNNLTTENYIKLCYLRLMHSEYKNINIIEIIIEDSSFKYFNGVSFIIKSSDVSDLRFSFSFDKFYPNEFMYLLSLGVIFED